MIVRRDWLCAQLLLVQILARNVVLWYLVRVHFPFIRVVSVLDTLYGTSFKEVSFFRQFLNAF
jgi:hypothetical protein